MEEEEGAVVFTKGPLRQFVHFPTTLSHLPKRQERKREYFRGGWKLDPKFKIPRGKNLGPYHAMKGAVIGQFRFHAAMERAKKEGGIYFPERGKTTLTLSISGSAAHSVDLLGKRKRGKKSRYKKVFALSDGRTDREEENSWGLLILAHLPSRFPSPSPSLREVFGVWS